MESRAELLIEALIKALGYEIEEKLDCGLCGQSQPACSHVLTVEELPAHKGLRSVPRVVSVTLKKI